MYNCIAIRVGIGKTIFPFHTANSITTWPTVGCWAFNFPPVQREKQAENAHQRQTELEMGAGVGKTGVLGLLGCLKKVSNMLDNRTGGA